MRRWFKAGIGLVFLLVFGVGCVSSFEFYRGEAFPAWQHDLIVGSLRARTLYRLRIEDGQLVDQEKLLTGLARIRDVEVGADGYVYLLLEHGEPGTVVRLVPEKSV